MPQDKKEKQTQSGQRALSFPIVTPGGLGTILAVGLFYLLTRQRLIKMQKEQQEQQKEEQRRVEELRKPLDDAALDLRRMGLLYLEGLALLKGLAAKVSQDFLCRCALFLFHHMPLKDADAALLLALLRPPKPPLLTMLSCRSPVGLL